MKKFIYPFTAIVGQDLMKEALILNVINPSLGGVLIKGEKGTAKSTAVRSLAELLPPIKCIEGCKFSCNPDDSSSLCDECMDRVKENKKIEAIEKSMRVIDLPLSATEDRVVGTLDIEYAIKNGEKKFEPGILALANRNVLYVDEVNLLEDHIVDVLLDAAAMGVNTIEREGISYTHPSRFVLVGTMNPEEGDLRPQLLDRFGLSVSVIGESDIEKRAEIVNRIIEFEKNPVEFAKNFEKSQRELLEKILNAKKILKDVDLSIEILRLAVKLSIHFKVDGHRADINIIKTALTIAAYEGRIEVLKEDLKRAARLVLPHRMRRLPFEEQDMDFSEIDSIIDGVM